MSQDENDGIFRFDTVPPPAGEDDAYSAPTRVGVMAESVVKEIMHAAEQKSAALREGEARKRASSGAVTSELEAPTSGKPEPPSSAKLVAPSSAKLVASSPAKPDAPSSAKLVASSPAKPEASSSAKLEAAKESAPRARVSKPMQLPVAAAKEGEITDADLIQPPRLYDSEGDFAVGPPERPREVTAPLPPELVNASKVAAEAKAAAASQVAEASHVSPPTSGPTAPAAQPVTYVPLVIGLALFLLGLALYAFR